MEVWEPSRWAQQGWAWSSSIGCAGRWCADRDQGLPKGKRQKAFHRVHERDESVEYSRCGVSDAIPPENATFPEPSKIADGVHVGAVRNLQSCLRKQVAKPPPIVAAVVTKRTIHFPIGAHQRWDQDHHLAAWLAKPRHSSEALQVVFDVLKHVQADHSTKGPGLSVIVGALLKSTWRKRDVLMITEPRSELREHLRAWFYPDYPILVQHELGDVADPGTDFADATSNERAYLIEDPVIVVVEIFQYLE